MTCYIGVICNDLVMCLESLSLGPSKSRDLLITVNIAIVSIVDVICIRSFCSIDRLGLYLYSSIGWVSVNTQSFITDSAPPVVTLVTVPCLERSCSLSCGSHGDIEI